MIFVHLPAQFLLLEPLFCPICLLEVFKHQMEAIGEKMTIYHDIIKKT